MSARYIFDTACKVIKKYNTRDPYELLVRMGAVVNESSSFDKLKGCCFYANRTSYVIYNGKLGEYEKRVVLAHEAAHLILHKASLKASPIKEISLYGAENLLEYEANMFAADFLIPDEAITEISDRYDIFEMSRKLYISHELLLFKLTSMNKRGYGFTLSDEINSSFLKKGDI